MAYYEDGQTGQPVSQETMSAIYKDVWKKLCATSDSVVLDVGGGVGMFSQAFQNLVKKMIGTDISTAMIYDARRINPRGTFLVCDAAALPLGFNTFDRVLCYSVFHYLKDLPHARSVLNEFIRVVKKDGLLLIGDILNPDHSGQTTKNNPPKDIAGSTWWPAALNHNLKKLSIHPDFFSDYCRTHHLQCTILPQIIPEKNTAASRYDVMIRFQP